MVLSLTYFVYDFQNFMPIDIWEKLALIYDGGSYFWTLKKHAFSWQNFNKIEHFKFPKIWIYDILGLMHLSMLCPTPLPPDMGASWSFFGRPYVVFDAPLGHFFDWQNTENDQHLSHKNDGHPWWNDSH